MAGEETTSNVRLEHAVGRMGLDMDSSLNQVEQGKLSYALNAALENFDANSVNYQNDSANELCLNFPQDYHLIGEHFINEQNKHIFFLVNPTTGASEIGYMENNDCTYHTYVSGACLNFNIDNPIHKAVHKISNCATEIYWTDGLNARRYLNLTDPTSWKKIVPGTSVCDAQYLDELDCNKLNIQPNFDIPQLAVTEIINVGGSLTAGTYQFAIQYSNASGDGYTAYYSVTNPTPIFDTRVVSADYNYPVGQAIVLDVSNIDVTGYFQYYNLAVIKTVNAITSVELIGTYFIDTLVREVTYTGQNQTQIRLTTNDIFEKFPYYEIAQDLTAVQDILVWDQLTSIDRINYQQIANQITLNWETYRLPANENYTNGLNTTNLRGYLRDEVYAFEIVFLLKNGKQTDGFHIPGRVKGDIELSTPDVPTTNNDFIGIPDYTDGPIGYSPYWKIYNTASVTGPAFGTNIGAATPYQYGEFAYWESEDTYPCNEDVWGSLSNTPIRHHKFPDILISPAFESAAPTIELDGKYTKLTIQNDAIYPIGVKLDVAQVQNLIALSSLSQQEKSAITGFKIVRGNRSTNSSIVAKGILRNVGEYKREETGYYFPNYPYNDLRQDPFLLEKNNAYNSICKLWKLVVTGTGFYQYVNCFTNTSETAAMTNGETVEQCSITTPVVSSGSATITEVTYETYQLTSTGGYTTFQYVSPTTGLNVSEIVYDGIPETVKVDAGTTPIKLYSQVGDYTITKISEGSNAACYPSNLQAFDTDSSKYRHIFNSPDTSFAQPFLGDILKLENVLYGAGSAHFVQVKKHAMYKLISEEAQRDALKSSEDIANITTTFNATAMFTAYQAYLQIYINGITRRNYTYSYNSIASYDYSADIANGLGVKQRNIGISQYLIPGVQNVGDDRNINNFSRESSVYLKTDISLPYPSQTPSLLLPTGDSAIVDASRYTIGNRGNCSVPEKNFEITVVSYYGSIKNLFPNQWGQMYSYDTIDTGFQADFDIPSTQVVFGGDTFINKFAFKTKLPFFIDNRVGAPDDSDIFYDEIGNVAYPEYWYSARSILSNYSTTVTPVKTMKNIISIKAHNFDCPNNQLPEPNATSTPPIVNPNRTFYDGKMYLFAYGIPYFYCESAVNVDARQAFNDREGDFYPHVSTGIPDNWLQESFVPIIQDNTYYYNPTFSKQNKENYFSHLPIDWVAQLCYTNFPFRTIYSEAQQSYTDNRINSWLIYRPVSFFDFPQNYGKLTSLDGVQNRGILARFENKTLFYNNLLTIDTSNPQAAYVGNPRMFENPPIDFAETDLGYVGSQHKMLLKIPQGQVSIDAKRGQVFLIGGSTAKDLSAFGSGLNRFFTDHLAFEILRYFPDVDVDNHFNGCGLHGVYDSKYERFFISKLDYVPLSKDIKYDSVTKQFYVEKIIGVSVVKTEVYLTDADYFCNKSWTLSFNFNTMRWVSFHSFIPNFYIAENNFFYSGLNTGWDLDIIAAQEVASTTTTTTTTVPLNCALVGIASIVNCGFTGNAVLLYPGIINWSNEELATPYIDSDLIIDGVTYGATGSGTLTIPPNAYINVKQNSDQNVAGTSATWTLKIINVTDGITVYSNLVTGLPAFGPGAYQVIQQTNFTVLPGKTYSVVAKSY